jgi:hypothetical protein
MVDAEEILDCMLSVDETLEEVEEALQNKNYSVAMHKLREARDAISEMRDDDEAEDDRQEVEMHVDDKLR